MISRTNVRSVMCPECSAPAGVSCYGPRRGNQRTACHAERWEAYHATLPPAQTRPAPLVLSVPKQLRPILKRGQGGWTCRSQQAGASWFWGRTPTIAYRFWLEARRTQVRERVLRLVPGAAAIFWGVR